MYICIFIYIYISTCVLCERDYVYIILAIESPHPPENRSYFGAPEFVITGYPKIRLRYRRETRQPLQTSAFLNIPERLLEDNDENLALNVARRSQRLIDIAKEVWPILQNGELSSSEKFEQISSHSAFIRYPEKIRRWIRKGMMWKLVSMSDSMWFGV